MDLLGEKNLMWQGHMSLCLHFYYISLLFYLGNIFNSYTFAEQSNSYLHCTTYRTDFICYCIYVLSYFNKCTQFPPCVYI